MKLGEYIKIKKHSNLNSVEAMEFGVKDFTKGWTKRYAENTAKDGVLQRLVDNESVSQTTRVRIKAFVRNKDKPTTRKVNLKSKYLYLIKNELGRYKIGVSEDPTHRAKVLSTAGGYYCDCVYYWDLKEYPPFKIEAHLHKVFKKYRILGEWFSADLDVHSVIREMSEYEMFKV